MTDKFRLTIMKQKVIERLFDKNSVLSIREVFEYKIGCNQLVNNICFICLEDDSLNNCWVKPITSVWNEALGWKLYHLPVGWIKKLVKWQMKGCAYFWFLVT